MTLACPKLYDYGYTTPKGANGKAIASYAFQIFRYYEQILRANPRGESLQQKAAYESQVERIRLSVARTKVALAEAMDK